MVNSKALVFIFTLCATSLFGQSGYQGKDFWVAFPQNARGETKSVIKFSIYITSAKNTTGIITDKRTGKETHFQLKGYTPYLYEADTMSQINNNGISNYSFHITTEHDATVICYSVRKASTDSYVAIPTNLLGTTYAVIGYDRLPTKEVTFTTQFDVIATEDNTKLTLTYPQGKAEALTPKIITLNKGEVYHQNSVDFIEYNYDLTGTIVTSNLPVAFLSGSSCAQVPQNKNFCDILLEMLPPSTATGKEFIIPALALRDTSSLRVVALENDTKITLNGSDIAVLRAGEYYQNDDVEGAVHIKTSHNAYVVQYCQSATASDLQNADPDMMVISPVISSVQSVDFMVPDVMPNSNTYPSDAKFFTDTSYTDSTVRISYKRKSSDSIYHVLEMFKKGLPNNLSPDRQEGWVHWVTIISKTNEIENIILDGIQVDVKSFQRVRNTAYSIAHLEVQNGIHRVSSTTGINVYSYGYGRGGNNYDSYGHNCGMNLLVGGQ